MVTSQAIVEQASGHLKSLSGHIFDLLTVSRPATPAAALNLSRIISKLSPLLGNLIEFNVVEFLNAQQEFEGLGEWRRQDPGFPDAVFMGSVQPTPGFEIKAWFPLATEITARFKDSQNHFTHDNTQVCLLAWLPSHLIWGKPYILDVVVLSGRSIAEARDAHYHNPPDYLVREPEDTAARTRNLRQTNTNGYKWQGTSHQLADAQGLVNSWGDAALHYSPTAEYQRLTRELLNRYPYRLDTNYGKIDRIAHKALERFKADVMARTVHGMTIRQWERLLRRDEHIIRKNLEENLGVTEGNPEQLIS